MTTSTQKNKELVHGFVEVINEQDWEPLDEFLAEDVVIHGAGIHGIDAFIERHQGFHSAFPDQTITVEDTVAEADRVAYRTTVTGTHEGEFRGIDPRGEEIEVEGISIANVEDGKLAEFWAVEDRLGMMQQLGVVEPLG